MTGDVPWRPRRSRPVSTSGMAALAVLVLVAVGAVVIEFRGVSDMEFARPLPAYHQLNGDDVHSGRGTSEADVVGHYTIEAVEEGASVQVEDLGPAIPAGSLDGDVIMALPTVMAGDLVTESGDLVRLQVLGSPTRICPVRILDVASDHDGSRRLVTAMSQDQADALSAVRDLKSLTPLRVWGYAEGDPEPAVGDICG